MIWPQISVEGRLSNPGLDPCGPKELTSMMFHIWVAQHLRHWPRETTKSLKCGNGGRESQSFIFSLTSVTTHGQRLPDWRARVPETPSLRASQGEVGGGAHLWALARGWMRPHRPHWLEAGRHPEGSGHPRLGWGQDRWGRAPTPWYLGLIPGTPDFKLGSSRA